MSSFQRRDKRCICCVKMPRKLDSENILILSLIQLLCGSAAIILFGVTLTKHGFLHQLGTGMWTGSIMLAAGCLGLATSRHRTPCSLVSLLVLCVLACIAAVILACLSIAALVQDGGLATDVAAKRTHLIVLHTLLFIVGFLECSVTFATAVICGRQVCCGVYLPVEASRAYRRGGRPFASSNGGATGGNGAFHTDATLAALSSLLSSSSSTTSPLPPCNIASLLRQHPQAPQIPVLATSSAHAAVLFDSDPQAFQTSLVYLLPPSTPDSRGDQLIFPPFPPSYGPEQTRPLSAYTSSDTPCPSSLQPALMLSTSTREERPPPYRLHTAFPTPAQYSSKSIQSSPDDPEADDDPVSLIHPQHQDSGSEQSEPGGVSVLIHEPDSPS